MAAAAEDDVEGSAVTVLVPVVNVEEPLVPELTAELVLVPITAAEVDIDATTVATDDVAGPSATRVAVACAVSLMPTMDRTHEAAASEYTSKYDKWTLVVSPCAHTGSRLSQYDRMTLAKLLSLARLSAGRGALLLSSAPERTL